MNSMLEFDHFNRLEQSNFSSDLIEANSILSASYMTPSFLGEVRANYRRSHPRSTSKGTTTGALN